MWTTEVQMHLWKIRNTMVANHGESVMQRTVAKKAQVTGLNDLTWQELEQMLTDVTIGEIDQHQVYWVAVMEVWGGKKKSDPRVHEYRQREMDMMDQLTGAARQDVAKPKPKKRFKKDVKLPPGWEIV